MSKELSENSKPNALNMSLGYKLCNWHVTENVKKEYWNTEVSEYQNLIYITGM